MITDIFLHLTNWITHVISTLGYMGVVVLMTIESAAIPLPSEIIMPFAGFLVGSGRFSLIGLGIAGGIGSVLGSLITYFLGFYGGRPLIIRYGRLILFSESDLNLAEHYFHRFGKSSAFFSRLIPGIRTFISVAAGIGKTDLWSFMGLTFLGSFIWSYLLAWLGVKLGDHWHDLEIYFRKFDLLIVAAIFILIFLWFRRHKKSL